MSAPEQLSEYATTREYRPGEYVFYEGDPGACLYIIQSGQVAVIKGAKSDAPLVLSYRRRGEIIGEISLLHETERTASVMAVEPTRLYIIEHNDFWDLLDNNAEFRRVLIQTLIDRLLTADESRIRAADAERELVERFSSLSSEHEKLAEVMQLRQETMRFIVHDLRNPLNLVIFAISLMENTLSSDARENLKDILPLATGSVQRMLTLIDALLEVERLEAGGITLERASTNLQSLLETTVDRLQPMAATYKVSLELLPTSRSLPNVNVDIDRLERVVTNLIDNALKFTPPDGMVQISAWPQNGAVAVAVDDNGPGIPSDERQRIFDRFAQLKGQDNSSRGFGLGLAFCRSAVLAHGGKIWVEEGPDEIGTRFIFTLPVED